MKNLNVHRLAKIFVAPILSIFYKIRVIGSENVPTCGRVILCSNHISGMDPILLTMALKRQIFFMAKEELFKNKFLSKLIRSFGAFPIKRGIRDTFAIKSAQKILNEGKILGIFIEGTRSKTGELLKPKPGAIILAKETYSKILPVCIKSAVGTRVKMFKRIIVNIGKIVSPEELGLENSKGAKELRDASRLVMSKIAILKNE